eukprot:TRINITY_DN1363_c0_g2_i1.p1 TRINITY_DN1363_c0_g2~~TRINITY_DN1363_c0_g2_i1.p1  ORF type:complete len:563 (+),score=254.02 TRINITY_DN1363_c0_g2_i1:78-1766(+)
MYGQVPMHNANAMNMGYMPNMVNMLGSPGVNAPQFAGAQQQNAALQEMLMREQINQMAYGMASPNAMAGMANPMGVSPMFGQLASPQMSFPQMQGKMAGTPNGKHGKQAARSPLGELPHNNNEGQPVDLLKQLTDREKLQRQNIQKMEITESARLEMNLQNTNIKKNSQYPPADAAVPRTPQGHGDQQCVRCPKTCEREENADGTIKYSFESGLPGGLCMYFMKGICGLGNSCRYVHDATDEGCIVKITGMPYTVQVEDIMKFFKPIQVKAEHVQFIISKEGKQSGSAFVEFNSRPDAIFALNRDREYISPQRFVLLYPSSKVERKWFKENPMPFSTHATPTGNKHRRHQASSAHDSSTPVPRHTASPAAAHVSVTPQQAQQAPPGVNMSSLGMGGMGMQGMPQPHPAALLQQIQQMQLLTNSINSLSPTQGANLFAPFAQNNSGSPLGVAAHVPAPAQAAAAHDTPVKQLSFDETDEPVGKQSDAAVQDLVKKLLNPQTLSSIPDETLSQVLRSVGYNDDGTVRGMVKQIKGYQQPQPAQQRAASFNALPPLVPMAPTKTA